MRFVQSKNRQKSQGGFTLLEVLVVVVILGLIAAILTVAVSKTLKRQRLDTAAEQLRSIIERAYVDTSINGNEVFVEIGAVQGDGSRTVRLREDSNGNGTLDNTDTVLATKTVTGDIALTNSTVAANAWPVISGALVLGCDTIGRAVNPTTNSTITQGAIVSLTHKEMLSGGNLTPRFRYDIMVYPIWNPTLTKVRY